MRLRNEFSFPVSEASTEAASPVDRKGDTPSADRILAETLRSTVEEAVRASVRTDRRVLADVLFPVLGPAIRLAVQNAFRDMIDALGAIISRNFTWTGLRWRWEAIRTGKSIGEVALLHSVLYRVEHAFVFHRDTGLLMLQRSHTAEPSQNIDVVPAMLTAIQDFMRDSFGLPGDTGLRSIRFGEFFIFVEHGAFANLAVVIRGNPPADLRLLISEVRERLQREGGREMMAFTGDTGPFERLGTELEACLEARYGSEPKPARRSAWAILTASLLALSVLLGVGLVDRARWLSYLDALREQPGIVLTSSERGWSHYRLAGLRDPLAADPTELTRRHRIDPRPINAHWNIYLSSRR
jgi:OOP family OmpA-OmpF porin